MSRVDEALRRAAEQADSAMGGAAGADVAVDMLPDEMTTFPAEDSPAAATDSSSTLLAESPESSAPSELFTHVDQQFAEKVVVDKGITPAAREQYRQLAARLHGRQVSDGVKVVLVVSAVSAEGKTLTSANVAMTLSESYQDRVLLIDGDLRRPSLDRLFGLRAARGLSDGLFASAEHKLPIHRVSERLTVLPAGRPNPDPMAGLKSARMQQIIEEAREHFDWVIIDTPPLVSLPDARLLARPADGVVLVVRAESTTHALVQRAVDAVGRDKILGVVLNGATQDAFSDYGYGSYYDNYHAGGAESGR
jgi:capsular exopolysaccharide synthesis family protein